MTADDMSALDGSPLDEGGGGSLDDEIQQEVLDVSSYMTGDFSEAQILKQLASNLANDVEGEIGDNNPSASGVFGNSFAKLVGSMNGMKSFSGLFNDSFVGMFAQPPAVQPPAASDGSLRK
jgi:hypothetical protein